jgi:uncharacterized Fe-S cluster-containing protein
MPTPNFKSGLKQYERQNIRRRYGCDPDDYIRVLEEQHGVCALCSEPSKHRLRSDTTRKDGKIKLVCLECFQMLQLVTKKIDKLSRYLDDRR